MNNSLTNEIIIEAETVEKAYKKAIEEYNLDKDKIVVEILQEESKGFITGLFGKKKLAKIKVKIKEDKKKDALEIIDEITKQPQSKIEKEQIQEHIIITTKNIVKDIIKLMNINSEIKIYIKRNTINIILTGKNLGVLIGKKGRTLYALQFILALILKKQFINEKLFVKLDIDNYRKKRERYLVKLANEKAKEVLKNKKEILLEPMFAFERKVIHLTIKKYKNLKTISEGIHPNRRVKIIYQH